MALGSPVHGLCWPQDRGRASGQREHSEASPWVSAFIGSVFSPPAPTGSTLGRSGARAGGRKEAGLLWPRGVGAGPGLGDPCGVPVVSSALVLGPGPEVWASPGSKPPGWCWRCLALFPQLWKAISGVSVRAAGVGPAWRVSAGRVMVLLSLFSLLEFPAVEQSVVHHHSLACSWVV